MRRIGTLSLLVGCVIAALFFGAAKADPTDPINQTFHIDVGMFFMSTNTTIRVDGTSGIGTDIDLGHDFDFKDQTRFRIDGYWRIYERHKIRFMYFDSSQGTDRVLSRDINFGDVTYPINASAHLDFKTQIIEGAYEYSFLRTPNFELAGTAGLHLIHVSTDLSAVLTGGGASGGFNKSSSASTNGPLPVIGLHFIWAVTPQMYFDGYGQFFKVKFDNYDGNLTDFKVDFVWQPFRNFGFGIGYNNFATRVDVDQDRFHGKLKIGYGGPLLFVAAAF